MLFTLFIQCFLVATIQAFVSHTTPVAFSTRNTFSIHDGVPTLNNIQNIGSSISSLQAANTNTESASTSISLSNLADKRILVVGGSGRVGGSVVCQLTKQGALVTVGGTNEDSFLSSQGRWKRLFPSIEQNLDEITFSKVDRENASSLESILETNNFDLVIHTAGPFQGKVKTPNGIIEACVKSATPYIDVCDDYCTARAAKSKYASIAVENDTPCIVSTGCW